MFKSSTVHVFSENFMSFLKNLQRSGDKKCQNMVKNWLKLALLDCFASWETIKTFSNNILVQTTEKYAINSVWLKFHLCEPNIFHVISINLLTAGIRYVLTDKFWEQDVVQKQLLADVLYNGCSEKFGMFQERIGGG